MPKHLTKEQRQVAFKAKVYKCKECGHEFYSKHSGHCTYCSCGVSMVDQTESYVRLTCNTATFTGDYKYLIKGVEV